MPAIPHFTSDGMKGQRHLWRTIGTETQVALGWDALYSGIFLNLITLRMLGAL